MSHHKSTENLTQHEMFESAQKRIKQKRFLFQHLILFVLGSIFMYVINQLLGYGIQYDWYIWGILIWGFIFLLHLINVLITNRFLGKDWERKQRAKLVEQQERRFSEIQNQQTKITTNPILKEEVTIKRNTISDSK